LRLSRLKEDTVSTSRGTPKTLADDEVRRVLTATGRSERDLRDHLVILLAVTTGLRVSELLGLNLGDVRNGKGVRSIVTLRPETTKGGKAGEIVIPEKARRKLATFLTWKERHDEPMGDDDPLFVSRGGGPAGAVRGARLSRRSAEHLFGVWQERAGLDRRLNFHALRHTFATKLLRATGNLRLVQKACRHSSVNTTTIYAHVTADDVAKATHDLGW
jgi:site-specific recombinase XerD